MILETLVVIQIIYLIRLLSVLKKQNHQLKNIDKRLYNMQTDDVSNKS